MRFPVAALLFAALPIASLAQTPEVPRYTDSGALQMPVNYREWVFLSSGLGMTYGPLAAASSNDHPSFDNVFVTRDAYTAFLRTGTWPDKTMFVLEVRSSESKGFINKGGHYQSDVIGIEVEVKDGGKWTFFSFDGGATEAKPLARTQSCYACHAQNGAVDNTFVQFYPTLAPIAKKVKTFMAR